MSADFITDEQIAEIEALANVANISRSGHEWFSNDECCMGGLQRCPRLNLRGAA